VIRTLLTLLFALAANTMAAQSHERFHFENGDLLFQDLDCGPLCDAIEAVTEGVDGREFSHVGLVYLREDSVFVIEASGADVHLTPMGQFLARSRDSMGRPKVVVGRVKKKYQRLREAAVAFAVSQAGTPYDAAFLYDNGKYYCSELVYDAFKQANGGSPFFRLSPMTFRDPSTGRTFTAWEQYYVALQIPVPEGQPGCNPGGLSRSPRIRIVHRFY
jgi:hypothetical protein